MIPEYLAAELIATVTIGKQMRKAQTTYFKTRSTEALTTARILESQFDKACAALDQPDMLAQHHSEE